MEKIKSGPEDIYDARTTKEYCDSISDVYSGERMTWVDEHFNSLIPQKFNGKTVLDHGCGNGIYGPLFCQRGAEKVVGIDLSPFMIREATKKKNEQQLHQLHFVQGDIHKLPFKEETFDFVFSRFSLIYSSDIVKVMKEIGKSLKENGEMLIETNVATIKNKGEIQNNPIPLILRFGDSEIKIKNFAITLEEYHEAFKKADLKILSEEKFPALKISIDDNYKDAVSFNVFIFKLKKEI